MKIFSQFKMIFRFLRYYIRATTVYQVHSPFLYELADRLLEDKRRFYAFNSVEELRKKMLRDGTKLTFKDPGAGKLNSGSQDSITRSIAEIAAYSVSPPNKCRTLFRLVLWRKPNTMLEIGTSLGIAALYQHAAAKNANFITLEGVPGIAGIAKDNFTAMKANGIRQITGLFQNTLQQALSELGKLDYVFIDGNHRKAPVLTYFHECLKYINTGTVVVIDDIYWSDEMTEAWNEIKNTPEVTCTIDLFYFGIVLFTDKTLSPKHNTWVKASLKPWILGFTTPVIRT